MLGLVLLMVGLSMLTLPEVQELLFRQPHRELPLSIRARRYGIALRRKLEVPEHASPPSPSIDGGAMPGSMDSGRSSAPLASARPSESTVLLGSVKLVK